MLLHKSTQNAARWISGVVQIIMRVYRTDLAITISNILSTFWHLLAMAYIHSYNTWACQEKIHHFASEENTGKTSDVY